MPEKNEVLLYNDLSSSDSHNRSQKYRRTIWNTFGLVEKHFSKENEPKKAQSYIRDRKVSGLFLRIEHQLIPWELPF